MRENKLTMAAVGLEPTPFRTGALNRRLKPLGHATVVCSADYLYLIASIHFLSSSCSFIPPAVSSSHRRLQTFLATSHSRHA
ncbi:unnamed protein product [Mesocestoides corti]|uniref:Uncharacterized protein n=1 Tax=Mesocestoides corti TaxID=53468 RepID=A0A0R3UDB8_MESCO|nr:unnamed protein product [Mesocestoides corti]